MRNEHKERETMEKYARYANAHLMERHCGILPHPDGWVVFGNLGRMEKTDRFIELLRGSHTTGNISWNEEDGASFALMVFEDEMRDDLMELWGVACGIYSREDIGLPADAGGVDG